MPRRGETTAVAYRSGEGNGPAQGLGALTGTGPGCDASRGGVMYRPVEASGATLERPAAVLGGLAWLQSTRGGPSPLLGSRAKANTRRRGRVRHERTEDPGARRPGRHSRRSHHRASRWRLGARLVGGFRSLDVAAAPRPSAPGNSRGVAMSRKKLRKALKDPNTVHQVRLSDGRVVEWTGSVIQVSAPPPATTGRWPCPTARPSWCPLPRCGAWSSGPSTRGTP
jgi:hypothetical protein